MTAGETSTGRRGKRHDVEAQILSAQPAHSEPPVRSFWRRSVDRLLSRLFPFERFFEEDFGQLRSDFQDGYIEFPSDKYASVPSRYVLTYALVVWILGGLSMKLTTEIEEVNMNAISALPFCLLELDMGELPKDHPLSIAIMNDFQARNIDGSAFLFHVTNATVTRLRKEGDKLHEHFTHRRYNTYSNHEHNMPKLLFEALREGLSGVVCRVGREIPHVPQQASIHVFSMGRVTLQWFRFCQGMALMTSLVLTAIGG